MVLVDDYTTIRDAALELAELYEKIGDPHKAKMKRILGRLADWLVVTDIEEFEGQDADMFEALKPFLDREFMDEWANTYRQTAKWYYEAEET